MRIKQWTSGACAALLALAMATTTIAQSRGTGRMAGVVKDESGQPIEGVQVKAVKAGEKDAFSDKSNKKGEWAIAGISSGQWSVEFSRDGFVTRTTTVPFNEFNRMPPIAVEIKKAAAKAADPNAEIRTRLEQAAPLMESGKFADARAVYDALLAKYPEAWQIEPLIARTYAGENTPAEAETHLRNALSHDPQNLEVKLLLASVLVTQGKTAESQKYLDGIEMTKIKDPVVFLNEGITLINQGKAAEALPIFDKVVAAFPSDPEGYYYRGRCDLALGKFAEAKADLQKFVAMPGADAAEVAEAKKILEQLK